MISPTKLKMQKLLDCYSKLVTSVTSFMPPLIHVFVPFFIKQFRTDFRQVMLSTFTCGKSTNSTVSQLGNKP